MKASLPASLRNVRGRPTSAAQPSAAVIPGTTTTGTPASRRYSTSSPPRPNTKGSPPLSRTTRRPARRCDEATVDLVLPYPCRAALLADEHLFGAAPGAIEHLGRHQLVVEHHLGISQRMEGTHR